MILVFKLLVTPLLILMVTLAGRRWGQTASGLLIGLPLSSGPISFFLALQQGRGFAARAAVGSIGGQISVCVFCLVYYLVSSRINWLGTTITALGAFILATLALNLISWTLLPAFAVLAAVIFLVLRILPKLDGTAKSATPPVWDLPARMIFATAFVLAVTAIADALGPQLSGLVTPLPVFATVIGAFTLVHGGCEASTRLVRGIVRGSWAYASFSLVVGTLLPVLGIAPTYALAIFAAIVVSAIVFLVSGFRVRGDGRPRHHI